MRNKFFTKALIILIMIAALTISGAVPSFAIATDGESDTTVQDASEQFDEVAQRPEIDSTSAILMDAETGKILYEKNAYEMRDPASITKILNCLVVLDNLNLDKEVTIDFTPETEGSVIKLQQGETLTIRDLVYGMMLWSGNDAAEALAIITAGDLNNFCEMMNRKAKELGAENTHYTNPNGLNPPKKVNNITTAYDIATVVRSAMKNPEFAKIVSTAKYTIGKTNKSEERKLKNSNRCLWDTKTKVTIDDKKICLKYDGCSGVKTGYSSTAGDCFAGFATRGNTNLVAVVLNASHEIPKFKDTIMLWNYGFANYRTYTVAKAGEPQTELKVKEGSLREVNLGLKEDMKVTIERDEDGNTVSFKAITYDEETVAPVKKGDELGYAVAVDAYGNELTRQSLISLESAEMGGPLSHIGVADEDVPLFLVMCGAAASLLVFVIVMITRLRKYRNPSGKY